MILITGGAGYIGSHTNKLLSKSGYKTIVFDNLSSGHKESVKWGEFVLGDLGSKEHLNLVFSKYKIKAIIHFAAFTFAGESVEDPQKYYFNNVVNTLNLLEAMLKNGCKYFIFSSTCATYGEPKYLPIDEEHLQNPINPYGQTKLIIEKILKDYSNAYGLKYINLRYFNAAGADIDGELGEKHEPETHLIPLVIEAALGKRGDVKIFGTDYDTPDGSALRDYIHVSDLSNAHLRALEYLLNGGESDSFNLGNGNGYSVLEIVEMVKKIADKDFKVVFAPKRVGDPAVLVGSYKKAKKILNWEPEFFDLETIVKSAYRWHSREK